MSVCQGLINIRQNNQELKCCQGLMNHCSTYCGLRIICGSARTRACAHTYTHTHSQSNNRMVLVVLCFISVLPFILSLRIIHCSTNIRLSTAGTHVFKMYYWPLKYCLVRRSSKTLYVKSVVSISDDTHRYTTQAQCQRVFGTKLTFF